MINSRQNLGSLLYMGKKYEIWSDPNQSRDLQFYQNKFWVNSKLAGNFDLITKAYDEFCEQNLHQIVEKGIAKLRTRRIKLALDFTDGQTNFKKDMQLSVDEYLKLIEYSAKIEFKIGSFKKEWGINQVNVKQKNFVLFFNLDLIKFDGGEHIDYVVAHELAHVFHRDHGQEFNSTLEKLFPQKRHSENFFDTKISPMLGVKTTSSMGFILFVLVCILLFSLWNYLSVWLQTLIFGTPAPTF